VLASSGIDYDIKLWMPTSEHPQFDEAAATEVNALLEMLISVSILFFVQYSFVFFALIMLHKGRRYLQA